MDPICLSPLSKDVITRIIELLDHHTLWTLVRISEKQFGSIFAEIAYKSVCVTSDTYKLIHRPPSYATDMWQNKASTITVKVIHPSIRFSEHRRSEQLESYFIVSDKVSDVELAEFRKVESICHFVTKINLSYLEVSNSTIQKIVNMFDLKTVRFSFVNPDSLFLNSSTVDLSFANSHVNNFTLGNNVHHLKWCDIWEDENHSNDANPVQKFTMSQPENLLTLEFFQLGEYFDVENLLRFKSLTKLRLSGMERSLTVLQNCHYFEKLSKLQHLTLQRCKIETLHLSDSIQKVTLVLVKTASIIFSKSLPQSAICELQLLERPKYPLKNVQNLEELTVSNGNFREHPQFFLGAVLEPFRFSFLQRLQVENYSCDILDLTLLTNLKELLWRSFLDEQDKKLEIHCTNLKKAEIFGVYTEISFKQCDNITEFNANGFESFNVSGVEHCNHLTLENFKDAKNIKNVPYLSQLHSLNISGGRLENMDFLRNATNLVELSLYDNGIKKITGIGSLKKLAKLAIHNNTIAKIDNLPLNLEHFALSNSKVKDLKNLNHLQSLKTLNFSENKIKHVEDLRGLKSLRYLNVRNNQLTKVDKICNLPQLASIDLSRNRISSVSGSAFAGLTNLQRLDLMNNPIKSLDFTNLYKLNRLQYLLMDGNPKSGKLDLQRLPQGVQLWTTTWNWPRIEKAFERTELEFKSGFFSKYFVVTRSAL